MREFDGGVRLVFKDFPLPMHDQAMPAHEAASCAGALGKYWPYHDRLFAAQPDFDRDALVAYAVDVGLSREAFTRCLDEHRFVKAIEADLAEGRAAGVRGTPTFLINGWPLVGAQPAEAFREAIRDALRQQQQR